MKKGWGGNNQVYCYYLIAFALIFFFFLPISPLCTDREQAEEVKSSLLGSLPLSLFSSLPFLLCLAMATRRSPSIRNFFIAAVLLLLIHGVSCFYLPGVAPEDFEKVSCSECACFRLVCVECLHCCGSFVISA